MILKAGASVTGDPNADVVRLLLERLLTMAQEYRHVGAIHEAIELYWGIVDEHPGTAAAQTSRAVLLEIAISFESQAAPHQARSIYERLLADGTD